MKVNKITKEDQEAKKSAIEPKKPPFSQWLLHDKKAFKITYLIGIFGGLLVTLGLLIASFILDLHVFFKALFGVLTVWQSVSAYKTMKGHRHINATINDLAYKGKYDSTQYNTKKEQYDASKQGATA